MTRSGRNRRQQDVRFRDDTVLELRVAHERGAEHRVTAFVVVDAGLTGCIDQEFGGHARGSLRGCPCRKLNLAGN
jgi:hypothetical protein